MWSDIVFLVLGIRALVKKLPRVGNSAPRLSAIIATTVSSSANVNALRAPGLERCKNGPTLVFISYVVSVVFVTVRVVVFTVRSE